MRSLYNDTQDEATLEEIFPPDTTVGNYSQTERKLKHQRSLMEEYDVRGASLEGKLKYHGKVVSRAPSFGCYTNDVQRARARSFSVIIRLSRTNFTPLSSLQEGSISNSRSCGISKP